MGLFSSAITFTIFILVAGQGSSVSPQSRLFMAPKPIPNTNKQVAVVPASCILFKILCPAGYVPGGAAPGPITVPTDLYQQRQDALANGNAYRSAHGAPPMTMDAALSAEAQAYAEELARTGTFKHSDPKGQYGENLALIANSPTSTIAYANDLWYGEKPLYCPAQAGVNTSNGHFTQMVWKASTSVGYGSAKGSDGKTYIVARYSPPGNYADDAMQKANIQC